MISETSFGTWDFSKLGKVPGRDVTRESYETLSAGTASTVLGTVSNLFVTVKKKGQVKSIVIIFLV